MKIYKVAHENIICPKEFRKIEIDESDLNELNINMTDEEIIEIMYNWLENQKEEFYRIGLYDLGDYDLVIER
jgi:hypothetical protein